MNELIINEKKLPGQSDLIDFEKQKHRELEGDDTITPLTNATFLKQLTKLKHHTTFNATNAPVGACDSSKSINSLKLSPSDSFHVTHFSYAESKNEDQLSITSVLSKRIKDSVPRSLQKLFSKKNSPKLVDDLQFFRSKAKFNNNKVGHDATDSDNLKSTHMASSLADFEKQINYDQDITFDKSSIMKNVSLNYKTSLSVTTKLSTSATIQSVATVAVNNTDQMYDAISSIMTKNVFIENDFIESVKLIVRQSELIRKKRLDLSIFMCRVFLFSFLIFMMAFFLGFFYTLNNISNEFYLKWTIENSKLNSTTTLS